MAEENNGKSSPLQSAVAVKKDESHPSLEARDLDEAQRLPGKILGVLIRQSREDAARSIEDCAAQLQVSPQLVEAWEYGDEVPSLPQLEWLARTLNVPLSQFLPEHLPVASNDAGADHDEFVALRQRLLGGLLRAARQAKALTIEQLSEMTAVDAALLRQYEFGEGLIPMDQLSSLAKAVDRDLGYFLEGENAPVDVSQVLAETRSGPGLPEELRQISRDDKTAGLIKLAVAFSHIPSEELHRIADALLALSAAKPGSNGA